MAIRLTEIEGEREIILKVFIASPGDLKPERKAILDVIKEINLIWSKIKNIKLVSLMWENDSYPDIGEYSQDVINKQVLNKEYDFFIGMLWSKFGTPTKNAGSCTEEEFNKAYAIFKKNPKLLKIMFYFKTKPIAIDDIEPTQIQLINNFKEKIKKDVLYWTFLKTEDFKKIVRRHLELHLIDWGIKWGRLKKDMHPMNTRIDAFPINMKIDEIIYFTEDDNIFEIYEKTMSEINKIKSLLFNITEKIKSNIPIQKPENMDLIRIAIESELFSIKKSVEIYLDGFRNATKLIDELNAPSTIVIDEALETISNMKSSFEKLISKVGKVIKAYRNYGGKQVNIAFRRSRKEFIFSLNQFKGMLKNIVKKSYNIEKYIESVKFPNGEINFEN
jgi:hypothetical protein